MQSTIQHSIMEAYQLVIILFPSYHILYTCLTTLFQEQALFSRTYASAIIQYAKKENCIPHFPIMWNISKFLFADSSMPLFSHIYMAQQVFKSEREIICVWWNALAENILWPHHQAHTTTICALHDIKSWTGIYPVSLVLYQTPYTFYTKPRMHFQEVWSSLITPLFVNLYWH